MLFLLQNTTRACAEEKLSCGYLHPLESTPTKNSANDPNDLILQISTSTKVQVDVGVLNTFLPQTMSVPVTSVPQQWVARLKMEPGQGQHAQNQTQIPHSVSLNVVSSVNSVVNAINSGSGATFVTASGQNVNLQNLQNLQNLNAVNVNMQGATTTTLSLTSMESYEEVFKEITKKLYGEESLTEVIDSSGNIQQASIVYETDGFRTDGSGGMTFVTAPNGALPPGTIVLQTQRKIHQDKEGRLWASVDMPQADQLTLATANSNVNVLDSQQQQIIQAHVIHTPPQSQPSSALEERWFESDEVLSWTVSKIARYNPTQKVFRCVDCDFVGFLSRVAEHWLGNHASLRVFQCPRCPYTSAWARCVRMHLQKQHGEQLTDNSLWKENPVLEEYKTQVTKFLTSLKTRVEQKGEAALALNGERRYTCQFCEYATDRRDLFNRHENIHREEKPFRCYVCEKQFNRADHVKKHFTRMHRDHPYDINKIKKHFPKAHGGVVPYHNSKMANRKSGGNAGVNAATASSSATDALGAAGEQEMNVNGIVGLEQGSGPGSTVATDAISLQLDSSGTVQSVQIPHIAYFNPPSTPGQSQSGPLQGIAGVGGTKKESKGKGQKKKKSGEKMFTCSYCPWQGVDNWCLKRHLNTHIKPFLCALCDYKAARSERLATHVLKVHNKRVCHKCSFLADDTESLSQHIQDSHQNPLVKTGFNCNVCQEYFELRADLEAHAILEHQKVIVQCDLCDFRTTDELSMEAHLREKHNLQPGMGAVAAAAAAAAAAAIGQPSSTQYQMQLPTQMHLQDSLSSIQHGSLEHQNLLLTSADQLNPNINMAATVASGDQHQHHLQFQQELAKLDTMTGVGVGGSQVQLQGDVHNLQVQVQSALPLEPELEPETLCEKCGIEFADEASLKLHEKRHELETSTAAQLAKESSSGGKLGGKKPLLRSYTCSTCSYTASTKKIMMQHQRAHNGLELVCKAEACLFSTPFDNTMKEHIHTEHGTEPNVRCPHCGLKIPSTNAFTYHWRAHHPNLCSLCVNLYRIKYGIKENDLHELISKSMLQLLNDDLQPKSKPVIQIQDQDQDQDTSQSQSQSQSIPGTSTSSGMEVEVEAELPAQILSEDPALAQNQNQASEVQVLPEHNQTQNQSVSEELTATTTQALQDPKDTPMQTPETASASTNPDFQTSLANPNPTSECENIEMTSENENIGLQNQTQNIENGESTDVNTTIAISNNNNNNDYSTSMDLECSDSEPLAKKPRLDLDLETPEVDVNLNVNAEEAEDEMTLNFSTIIAALQRKNEREAIKILPNMTEVLVIPVISEKFFKTYTKTNADWIKKSKSSKGDSNSKSISVSPPVSVETKLVKLESSESSQSQSPKKKPGKDKGNKPPRRMKLKRKKSYMNGRRLRIFNIGLDEMRLLPLRRYISRGSRTWLRRHCRSSGGGSGSVGVGAGGKCHSWMCQERSRKYFRRYSAAVLHRLWHHSKPTYACDSCSLRFVHLYQAYLHKLKVHRDDPNSNVTMGMTKPEIPQMKFQQQQIIITSDGHGHGHGQEGNLYGHQEQEQEQQMGIDQQQQQHQQVQLITGYKTEIR